jgi:hypothetical protein
LTGKAVQRGNGHATSRLDAAPGVAGICGAVVVGGRLAPFVEGCEAVFTRKGGLDRHADTRPFVTRTSGVDIAQGGADTSVLIGGHAQPLIEMATAKITPT